MIKFIKDNLKYILTIIIFAIVCIVLTILLTKGSNNTNALCINIDPDAIDLYGTYDMNDLNTDLTTYEYNNIKTNIVSISGLKNKEVENKINDEIKNKVNELIDNGYNFFTSSVTANYSNILSLNIYANIIKDGRDNNRDARNIYLNYNLNDGSHIAFSDLFTNDASVSLIVRNAMYDKLVQDSFYNEVYTDNGVTDESYESLHKRLHTDAMKVDDDLLTNEVYRFMNTDDDKKAFSIYPAMIKLYSSDKDSSFLGDIIFIDNANDIAVYDRYELNDRKKNKSIYENIFAPKDVITCANYTQDYLEEELRGEITSNLYIDFSRTRMLSSDSSYDIKLGEEKIKIYNEAYDNFIKSDVVNDIIKDLKKKANKDRGRYYYVSFISLEANNLRVYQDELATKYDFYAPSNAISYHIILNTYRIPKKAYEEKYHDRLLESYRSSSFNYAMDKRLLFREVNEYDKGNKNDITFTHDEYYELYNFMTGEKIDNLDKLFQGNVITLDVLYDEFFDECVNSWKELSEDEANRLLSDGITYEFTSDCIEITSNVDKDEKAYLYYNEIDLPLFTIFDDDIIEEVKKAQE